MELCRKEKCQMFDVFNVSESWKDKEKNVTLNCVSNCLNGSLVHTRVTMGEWKSFVLFNFNSQSEEVNFERRLV